MKKEDLMILAVAVGGALLIVKSVKANNAGAGAVGGAAKTVKDFVSEILGAGGETYPNGWRYFSDGTTIDPAGNYYANGQLVWTNPANARYSV